MAPIEPPATCGRHRATCFSMSGVSGVSGALANEGGSVVVGTDKPVFSDDSGIRAAVLKGGVWAICLIAVLLGGALVLTLRTHVTLPGVDGLLPASRGQIERRAVSPTEESSQPPQPSITLLPSPSRSGRPTPRRARQSTAPPQRLTRRPLPHQERPPRPLVPPPALKKRRRSATPRRRIRPYGVRGQHRSLAMVQDEFNA